MREFVDQPRLNSLCILSGDCPPRWGEVEEFLCQGCKKAADFGLSTYCTYLPRHLGAYLPKKDLIPDTEGMCGFNVLLAAGLTPYGVDNGNLGRW